MLKKLFLIHVRKLVGSSELLAADMTSPSWDLLPAPPPPPPHCPHIYFAKLKFMHSITYHYCPSSFYNNWQYNNVRREHDRDLRNQNMYFLTNPRIELLKKIPSLPEPP
jgi:hypothetical protein